MPNLYNHFEVRKTNVWSPHQNKIGRVYLRTASDYQSECEIPRSFKTTMEWITGNWRYAFFPTKTEAGVVLLKEVRERLLESPKMSYPKKLLHIAHPITSKMTQLRPSLSKEFDSHLSVKHSLIKSLISMTGSLLLHVRVVWLYHRYKHRHPNTPLWCGLFCPGKPKATRWNTCQGPCL